MILRNSVAAALGAAAISALGLLASVSQAQTTTTTTTAPSIRANVVTPGTRNIFALASDNAIYVLRGGATQYARLGRAEIGPGNLIGIDFRPADNNSSVMYGLDDLGNLFKIAVNTSPFTVTKVSTMTTRFTGGFANLMDFNPVANALRVTGATGQNLAVVNGADGTNLSTTVVQTTFAYAAGDVNAGKIPQISGGAYNNNFVGATATLFYVIDHDLDTLATISTKTATGSSNTAGGQLQTIGRFVDEAGNKLNMAPDSDFDIYTDSTGKNFLVGQTKRLLFSIDLSQINPNLAVGQTQNVVVKRGVAGIQLSNGRPELSGGVIDIAIPPRPAS